MSEMDKSNDHSRREFVKVTAAATAGAAVAVNFGKLRPAFAAGSDEIRVGLVGCGGRGTGAAAQALKAAPGVKLIAVADAFKDRLDGALANLNKDGEIAKNIDVPADRQFVGLDAYQKLLKTDVNYVIIASPPGFKADQITAAIAAGKHVFTEKPMAVDGPTLRTCFAAAEEAQKKGLAVGVGLQRRHQKGYLEVMKRVHGGQIGEITSARVYWNQGSLWMKPRDKAWSDLEWQMRNWLYFTWLSGDHIVEQHIHNIDVASWGIGKPPVAAVALGGRQQRVNPAFGHIYDHFAVDFEYPNDVHVMSMCRQIPNCANDVSEHLVGTKGRADTNGKTYLMKLGKKAWTHDASKDVDPYLQEHIDLIASIRKGKPLNELKSATDSNLAAVMGRMAAYTGKKVTYQQVLDSKESLVPKALDFKSKMTVPTVAMPGASDII
jgi:myo-inositol 2-dehydrogenase/D-chiro-inositol 1-dehydrogenase